MSRTTKISLNVDREMLERARQMGIDLDETFEHALRRLGCEDLATREARWAAWREENREATIEGNKLVEENGLWWESIAHTNKNRQALKKARPKP